MKPSFRFLPVAVAMVALCSAAWADGIPNLTPLEQANLQQLNPTMAHAPIAPGTYPQTIVDPRIRVMTRLVGPDLELGTPEQVRERLLVQRPGALRPQDTANGGFETGDLSGWTTLGSLGTGYASVCGSAVPADALVLPIGLQPYANNDPQMNQVYTGNYACRLGDDLAWGYATSTEPQCSQISQDVALPVGQTLFRFAYAVLASNPGHGLGSDPYFNVRVEDLTVPGVLYNVTDYTTSYDPANPCGPWCLGGYDNNGGAPIVYRRWEEVTLDLSAIAGHTVRLSLMASDCSPSAHFCEAFLDGAGVPCRDLVAPNASPITATCRPDTAGTFCATVKWNAPSDSTFTVVNGTCTAGVGPAAAYDLRWSTAPIVTQADFDAATLISGEPAPASPGSAETFTLCGLPGGNIYFGLQNIDANFNRSALATAPVNCVSNQPPDCSTAVACRSTLWPADHRMVTVHVVGVTDPDNDPLTIQITGVTQDEPLVDRDCDGDGHHDVVAGDLLPDDPTIVSLDGMGDMLAPQCHHQHPGDGHDHHNCPDAIIGTGGSVQLRAERRDHGNGRVYVISFTATDSMGATCSGTVTVCVPARKRSQACIDDGQQYISTGPCPARQHMHDDASDLASLLPEKVAFTTSPMQGNLASVDFALPTDTNVRIELFDLSGRRIMTVADGMQSAGTHHVTWNAASLANGMYFYRFQAGPVVLKKSVLVVR